MGSCSWILFAFVVITQRYYTYGQSPEGFRCPANQTYTQCSNHRCPDQYCPRNDASQPLCFPPLPDRCVPGCQCKLNYRYDYNNRCILARECPRITCRRQNEVFNSCPSACLAEGCDDKDDPPAACSEIIENCQPRCVCRRGYFRNVEGLCIPRNQCPSCPRNERYSTCIEAECRPMTCSELGHPVGCPIVERCTPGCVCKQDHVRNNYGICVNQTTCPSCGGDPNAVAGCGHHCDDRCPSYPIRNQTQCIQICGLYGCNCRKGFLFNGRRCVEPRFCPISQRP